MQKKVVNDVLRIAARLEDKPKLRELFENGTQGWSKFRSVSKVATEHTDGLWAKRVKTLSKAALEELVKGERARRQYYIM